ncbi:hypothetical protein R1sor_026759 [Riccia sorocarpa]|uniref:Reverse transcriptase domain-containing protein n=1 Tax=Riccia sorocarpa TaxID=122646 RepID=A0ABD3GG04_9MARC
MLNTGYKIISKLIANRLREVIGSVVDKEQKGFIKDRSITDNVQNYLICQEWAQVDQQPTLFVKLDFENFKAYDRVNHKYLWETMEAMGFCSDFTTFVKGLVQGSTSKIHVNGQFSEDIQIERGVKQGCPLAPLLFALSTQPVMGILAQKQVERKLTGLTLCGNRQALHNLFADDTGVMLKADPENFSELQNAISLYEEISGAKLNMVKSTIIPIAMTTTPEWLQGFGCYIARDGEVIRYLGHSIGRNVKETQKCDYILGKLQRRLGSWTYRMLSFAGRMIVMKHILKAMPNLFFTCLTLNQKALDRLEAVSRKFLWGLNASGGNKIPLIAWNELGKAKNDGARNRKHWSATMILISQDLKRIPKTQTLTGYLGAWNEARNYLRIRPEDFCLEGWSPTTFYIDTLVAQGRIQQAEAVTVRKVTKREHLETVGRWADWAWGQNHNRPLGELEEQAVHIVFDRGRDYLNRKWGTADNARRWAKRFTKLWKSYLPPGDKIWMWKVFLQGLPTMDRAQKWGHGDGMCARCGIACETVDHLFWNCQAARKKWRDVEYLAEGLEASPPLTNNWIEAWDMAFRKSIACYLTFTACMKAIWTERNHKTYAGTNIHIPLAVSLKLATTMVKAKLQGIREEDRNRRMLLEALDCLKSLTSRLRNEQTEEPPLTAISPETQDIDSRDGEGNEHSQEGGDSTRTDGNLEEVRRATETGG